MSSKELTQSPAKQTVWYDDFFRPWNEWFGKEISVPAVNITESKGDYRISVAAPGLKKDDFNINIEGNILTISSEKEVSREEKEAKYTRKEYNYSSFSRSFTLPEEVNQEKIEAAYENGVLNVTLPIRGEAKRHPELKHINVK